jgi:hypothetical protein
MIFLRDVSFSQGICFLSGFIEIFVEMEFGKYELVVGLFLLASLVLSWLWKVFGTCL